MKKTKDLFSDHAQDYARFRPSYPADLFDYLLSITSNRDLAWDAATGNGQIAIQLANSFKKVIATDISAQQLAHAPVLPGIVYAQSRAEKSDITAGTVNLITVGQALHWFSIPEFFQEVKRVIHPTGVLACFGYGLLQGPRVIQSEIEKLYYKTLDGYWPPERHWIETSYAGIGIPFSGEYTSTTSFRWSVSQLLGYLSTWSAVKAYERETGRSPLEYFRQLIGKDPDKEYKFTFPVFLKTWHPALDV